MESDRARCRTRVRSTAFRLVTAVGITLVAWSFTSAGQKEKDDKDEKVKRASLSLRVSPAIAFSPARVVVSAELRGGSPDDAELYCPSTEWDWGDGTRSEANENCEPFEAGKSEIRRRWTASHTYTTQGNYRVLLRLKRGERTVAAGNTNLQIKPGARDFSNSPFDQP